VEDQPYPVLGSRVDPRSPEFRANHEANTAAVGKLAAALAEATVGGGEKYTARHKAAGKLLPRERIELLVDRDSYFLELAPLAGMGVPGHTTGAGFIGGVGRVSGVECVISANDSTVKGGAISEITAWKSGRCNDIAEANRLPTISLIESAGADLPNQSKIFVPGGRGFRDLTRRSEAGLPSICLVFGSSTATRTSSSSARSPARTCRATCPAPA
jgi:acetyl-CoA carboxylase carboxyltransferase component